MNQNPYAGPVYSSENAVPTKKYSFSNFDRSQGPRIFVDGPYLVVETGSVLPNRCPLTNEPVTESSAEPTIFTWTPDYLILILLVRGLPGVFLAYFMFRRQCTVWLTLSQAVKSSMARRVMQRIFFLLASFGVVAGSIYFENWLGVVIGFLMLIVAGFLFLIPTFGVSVSKQEKGLFCLKGCHPSFLYAVANGEVSNEKKLL